MEVQALQSYYEMLWPIVSGLLLGLVILIAGWVVAKWAKRLTLRAGQSSKLDEALARFFSNIVRYTVLAATVIAALGAVGIETTSLLTVFASAGLAIGLALQGSLANFAAGVMILFFRPFDLDDAVTVAGQTAKVTDIGLFATTILTPDNDVVIIPNGKIIGDVIVNHTRKGTRRAGIDIGVAYGCDLARVKDVLLEAARGTELVMQDPEPGVAIVAFGGSSVDLKVFAWANVADFVAMQHNLKKAVYDALNDAGIDIPFPQMVLHKAEVAAAQAAK